LIFLLPLSTARGRLRAEKKKRFKLFPRNLASKHILIFYTAIPFQNAENNFSTYKTHQVIAKRNLRTQK
jgi:hypothetical protein